MFKETKEGTTHYYGACKCACHDSKWLSVKNLTSLEHSSPCCKKMNGFLETSKPRLMFAVVWENGAGSTINLFKNQKMAEEYLEAIK